MPRLNSRLDLELVTQNVMSDPNGLYYVSGSYHAFGNDGSVSNVVNSTTALSGLPNRTAVLSALTITSDHLPIVADYTDTVTPPVGPSYWHVERQSNERLGRCDGHA